jgi:GTPase SAR1 family protein
MLVGQGRAGKTALANNMMGKGFKEDTESTIGAEKFERRFMCGQMKKDQVYGATLVEYVSSPKEMESVMAMSASRNISELKTDDSSSPNTESKFDNFLVGAVLDLPDVDTAIFSKCLSENIARQDEGSELIISLYDFGGQDIFNVLHPFFMSKYGVYIVVFDMELFLSKDEEKKESCMKHLKFWMNSICLHTFDEKSGKTAAVAIVGTRKDVISKPEDHEAISRILKVNFYRNVLWKSLLVEESSGICFFPVNNAELSSFDFMITQLLKVSQSFLENASFVTEKVPLFWLKVLDEIKAKEESFLKLSEIIGIFSRFSMSAENCYSVLAIY